MGVAIVIIVEFGFPSIMSHISTVERVTMATLTKLFRIRIVASSFLGRFANARILLSELFSLFLHSSSSFPEREKKATSDPEIIADKSNRIASTTREMIPNGSLKIERRRLNI